MISYLYDMVLNITEDHIHDEGQKKNTKIVNIYDNKLGKEPTKQWPELQIQQAIEDFP